MAHTIIPILITTVGLLFNVFRALVFIRILLSWFPLSPGNQLFEILLLLTEPVLGPIRKMIANSPLGGPGMMLDLSPIIAIVLMSFVYTVFMNFLRGLI